MEMSSLGNRLWQITPQADEGIAQQAVEHGGFDGAPWKVPTASLQQAPLYPPYRVTARVLAARGIAPDFEGLGDTARFIGATAMRISISSPIARTARTW